MRKGTHVQPLNPRLAEDTEMLSRVSAPDAARLASEKMGIDGLVANGGTILAPSRGLLRCAHCNINVTTETVAN